MTEETPEPLDLERHDPEEYQGKLVTCNGAHYVVSAYLGSGQERFVHKLKNIRSGLCLHVIKILRSPRPRGAYTAIIARLRSSPEMARVIPISLECEVPGGFVELQTNAGSWYDDARQESALFDSGFSAMKAGDQVTAIRDFTELLKSAPCHSPALLNLAGAHAGSGDWSKATATARQAVDIEPNEFLYREALVKYGANQGMLRAAADDFNDATKAFPNVFDLHEFVVQILLDLGLPSAAAELMNSAILNEEVLTRLKERIGAAIRLKQEASAYILRANEYVRHRDDARARQSLENARSVYQQDLDSALNLAFCMGRLGDADGAAKILLASFRNVESALFDACTANIAFNLIRANSLSLASQFLHALADSLHRKHSGHIPGSYTELPGIAIWIDGNEVTEEAIGSAYGLIEHLCSQSPKHSQALDSLLCAYRAASHSSSSQLKCDPPNKASWMRSAARRFGEYLKR